MEKILGPETQNLHLFTLSFFIYLLQRSLIFVTVQAWPELVPASARRCQ